MSSPAYQRLNVDEDTEEAPAHTPSYRDDSRFYEPPVAAWKRIALLVFLVFLFYVGYKLRTGGQVLEGQIVHADRYSDQHKFRPAASPIIRRRLPDGRIEVRGDHVGHAMQRRHRADEL